jgi:hypothetical protein
LQLFESFLQRYPQAGACDGGLASAMLALKAIPALVSINKATETGRNECKGFLLFIMIDSSNIMVKLIQINKQDANLTQKVSAIKFG